MGFPVLKNRDIILYGILILMVMTFIGVKTLEELKEIPRGTESGIHRGAERGILRGTERDNAAVLYLECITFRSIPLSTIVRSTSCASDLSITSSTPSEAGRRRDGAR